jgi:hypothetical protein
MNNTHRRVSCNKPIYNKKNATKDLGPRVAPYESVTVLSVTTLFPHFYKFKNEFLLNVCVFACLIFILLFVNNFSCIGTTILSASYANHSDRVNFQKGSSPNPPYGEINEIISI